MYFERDKQTSQDVIFFGRSSPNNSKCVEIKLKSPPAPYFLIEVAFPQIFCFLKNKFSFNKSAHE